MNTTEIKQKLHQAYHTSDELLKSWKNSKYNIKHSTLDKFCDLTSKAKSFYIYGDYDVDGICSTKIMHDALKELAPDKNIICRLPRRFTDGYGINPNITKEIMDSVDKDALIICVDNGIAGKEALNPLYEAGYKIVILDHHNFPKENELPKADLIIDAHAEALDNPLTGDYWCGAGVCYQLIKDLISDKLREELFFYASLATVADCMDMVEGNWAYVRTAIDDMRRGDMPESMKSLLIKMKQTYQTANEDTFGFYLGPCLNAPGRLLDEGAALSLEYLLNPTDALADRLVDLNSQRKQLRDDAVLKAKEYILNNNLVNACPLWIYLPNFGEGIVGLVAGQIENEFHQPVIVVTEHNGVLKGSGRAPEGFNLYDYLSSLPQNGFISWGGHSSAAGLCLTKEAFEDFSTNPAYKREKIPVRDSLLFDIEDYEIPNILKAVNALRPFGMTREAPVFHLSLDLTNSGYQVSMVGNPPIHLSIRDIMNRFKIMSFNHTDYNLMNANRFEAEGQVTENFFRGQITAQFQVKDCYNESPEKGKTIVSLKENDDNSEKEIYLD